MRRLVYRVFRRYRIDVEMIVGGPSDPAAARYGGQRAHWIPAASRWKWEPVSSWERRVEHPR